MNYIKDWCKIIKVDGYNILVECYWKTDEEFDPELHHEWVIKASTELDRGRFVHMDIVCNDDGSDMTDDEIMAEFNATDADAVRDVLKEWLELNKKGGPGLRMGFDDDYKPDDPSRNPQLN
jgi:hypothetical protein